MWNNTKNSNCDIIKIAKEKKKDSGQKKYFKK